jgi:hypothetical protein
MREDLELIPVKTQESRVHSFAIEAMAGLLKEKKLYSVFYNPQGDGPY